MNEILLYSNKLTVRPHLPILTKVYVWSIILEPLYFFILFHPDVLSINISIARLLQAIVIISFCIKCLYSNKVVSFGLYEHRFYLYYLLYVMIVSVIGIILGYYLVGDASLTDNNITNIVYNSIYRRPLLEYFIAAYFYIYFVILAVHLLANPTALRYCLNVVFFVLTTNLFVGYLDLILLPDFALVSRHMFDSRDVGFRFHGFLGEPRDAFPYLIFCGGMLHAKSIFTGKRSKTYKLILVVAAIILTYSASGLVGLLISCFIMIFYCLGLFTGRLSSKVIVPLLLMISIIAVTLPLIISSSKRLTDYYDELHKLIVSISQEEVYELSELSYLMRAQGANIYPIMKRTSELSNSNIIIPLIGTGLGSSSILNINEMGSARGASLVNNPHAQIIRLIYDTGLIGTLLYLMGFIIPAKKLSTMVNDNRFTYIMIMVLGVTLGHRSYINFIFLGIVMSYTKILSNRVACVGNKRSDVSRTRG